MITCKRCDNEIPKDEIDTVKRVASCGDCGAVFGYDGDRPIPVLTTGDIAMPSNISVSKRRGDFHLKRRWFSGQTLFLTIFTVVWCGFLVFWYNMAFDNGNLAMVIFPIFHVLVGLGLMYYTIASYLNHTHIRVIRGQLKIRHVPVPMPGNFSIGSDLVEQIFVKQHIQKNKNHTYYRYSVNLLLRNKTRKKLVGGLDKAEQALFIERVLEEHLHIVDRHVTGEFK